MPKKLLLRLIPMLFNKTQPIKFMKLIKMFSYISFVLYLFTLLYLTLLKRILLGNVTGMFLENYNIDHSFYLKSSVNLIPFKTITRYLAHPPSVSIAMTNIAGNILAFLPLGFLTPFLFKGIKNYKSIIVLSIITSILIEFLQLFFRVGSVDIDDVILNALGGLIGYSLLSIALIAVQGFVKRFGVKEQS